MNVGDNDLGIAIESHVACVVCDSSDGMTVYEDEKDGSQYFKCFSCGKGGKLMNDSSVSVYREAAPIKPYEPDPTLKVRSIPERDISKDTCEFFGVVSSDEKILFPFGTSGAKVRNREEKKFHCVGKLSGLFGQDKFPAGGRYVTITEGEIDALSVFQMTGSKYPTVSVPNGAEGAVKAAKEAFEWLSSFEHIVICFDADEPGQRNAKKVAELFGAKAKIVKLNRHKDANEYLMAQEAKDFVDAWWKAETFTPDGIVAGSSLWGTVTKPVTASTVQYPFEELNKLTFGVRPGELVMVTAGSGLGKSQFLREIVWKIIQDTQDNIGMMFLEESVQKTAISMMSLAANKPLHLPTTQYTPAEYEAAFNATLGLDRLFFFDHFGSTGIDNIVNRVRYMAKALNCKYVILDHISIVVSAQESGDERKALDEIMTRLRTIVQETGISLFCVSHLKRPEGKGHEEGVATSLAQLRGSGAIAQLSDIVIGLERNAQHSDPLERNTTVIRVLKNRFSGLTGPAGKALYDLSTGRMLDKTEEEM
jgi:twinkle protein